MLSWLSTYFVAPIALLGLLAISIPIIIHLISKSKVRPVLFGHLDLIPSGQQKPVTQINLTQWLLLLLRILMLVVLTLLLSKPLLTDSTSTPSGNIRLLVTPSWLEAASQTQRAELLDRINAGGEAWLAGYPSTPLSTEQIQNWRVRGDKENLINLWAQLQNTLGTTSDPVAVYHTGKIEEFNGPRVLLTSSPERVEWHHIDALPVGKGANSVKKIEIGVIESADPTINQHWQTALSLIQQHGIESLSWQLLPPEQQIDFTRFTLWIDISERAVVNQISAVTLSEKRLKTPDFPLWLADQLLTITQQQGQRLLPVLSAQQIQYQSELTEDQASSAALPGHRVNIETDSSPSGLPWLASILLLLFCTERLVSEYLSPGAKESKE
ncbi:hypothetical protein EXU34_12950 [Alteromonas sp. ZYF713]|nr:hypothetical protein [Alteromonas sp. ZYF713]